MMNTSELWDRYCRYLYSNQKLGFSLDISRMNFSEAFLAEMEPRMQSAYQAMTQLEAGAIANPDEERMVGHYWLRAPQLAPHGLGESIETVLADIKSFAAAVHSGDIAPECGGCFENLLLVGIGGSALGPQFVANALAGLGAPGVAEMTPYFFDNTDPDGIARVLARLDDGLARTLTIVISKSGGTPETRNGMVLAQAAYHEAGLHFGHHAVAVTGEGSRLDLVAENERWLARFPMWDWVGGRTSELSAVGLLPAALQGFDIDALLRGAREMDEATRNTATAANPAALLALMWYFATDGRGTRDMVILPYKDRLLLFSRYLQQLVMESLGKELDLNGNVVHQGIAVYGNKGSTDQHAYVQQLRDGVNNFFVTFIEVLRDSCLPQTGDPQQNVAGGAGTGTGTGDKATEGGGGGGNEAAIEVEDDVTSGDFLDGLLHGTRRALAQKDRQSITLTVETIDAATIGRLIALFERAVGFYGSLINVNAYHQPGVEAGKKAAHDILQLQRQALQCLARRPGSALTAAEVAKALAVPDETETLYHALRHLAANRRVAAQTGCGPHETVFAAR